MEITITIKSAEGLINSKSSKNEMVENDVSIYARFFDESRAAWTNDSEHNYMFLKLQQDYANDMLKCRGYMFLNEVYDMLGIERSKAGQVVGWIYDQENAIGDNYIDFGLRDERNSEFINGNKRSVLLDFNVDGCILDKI